MTSDLFDVVSSKDDGETIVLRVLTEPGAGKPAVAGRQHDALRLRLAMPPSSDRANAACIELVADIFSVAQEKVSVEEGINRRQKRLTVRDVAPDDARAAIQRAIDSAGGSHGQKRAGN